MLAVYSVDGLKIGCVFYVLICAVKRKSKKKPISENWLINDGHLYKKSHTAVKMPYTVLEILNKSI